MSVVDSMKLENEKWENVPGYEGFFQVSDMGRVKSVARKVLTARGNLFPVQEKILKLRELRTGGYLYACLSKHGNYKMIQVHSLVLSAFVESKPNGMQCRHLDGNNKNNELSNLKWGTPKENAADRIRHGRGMKGSQNGNSKLNEDDVRKIRIMHASKKYLQRELSVLFGIDQTVISDIILGYNWSHVV